MLKAQSPKDCIPTVKYRGEGTYYGATGAGNCSFDPSPQDLMVAAMNAPQYANSEVCGACVRAKGPKGTVDVRIVDQCPECKFGDLDFSLEAFIKIADQIAGRVPIEWEFIPCPVGGNISFRYKEGSSQWWIGIQVRNHRYAIKKLEYKNRSGQFVSIPREHYNYFVASSGIDEDKQQTGPYHFRITDIHGQEIEETNIPFRQNQIITGRTQFPFCRANPVSWGQEAEHRTWSVFPNPFIDRLYLIAPYRVSLLKVRLMDLQGRQLLVQDFTHVSHNLELLLPNLTPGVYYLQVEDSELQTSYGFRIFKTE